MLGEPMKTLKQLRQKLAKIGATLDEQAEQFVVCDAPSGYVWKANQGTAMTIQYRNNGGGYWLPEALRQELPCLQMGLMKVTDPEHLAIIRWDLDDDTWGAAEDAPENIEWPR